MQLRPQSKTRCAAASRRVVEERAVEADQRVPEISESPLQLRYGRAREICAEVRLGAAAHARGKRFALAYSRLPHAGENQETGVMPRELSSLLDALATGLSAYRAEPEERRGEGRR